MRRQEEKGSKGVKTETIEEHKESLEEQILNEYLRKIKKIVLRNPNNLRNKLRLLRNCGYDISKLDGETPEPFPPIDSDEGEEEEEKKGREVEYKEKEKQRQEREKGEKIYGETKNEEELLIIQVEEETKDEEKKKNKEEKRIEKKKKGIIPITINGEVKDTYSTDSESSDEDDNEMDLSKPPLAVIDLMRKVVGRDITDKCEQGYRIEKKDLFEITEELQAYLKENLSLVEEMIKKYVSEEVKKFLYYKIQENTI